jgi:hypothetical protein
MTRPDPDAGKQLELGIFGSVWTVELPLKTGQHQIGEVTFSQGPGNAISVS